MASRGSQSAQRARIEADRARKYAARTAWHEGRIKRRVRDNVIAGVVGGLLIVAAVVSQVLHAQSTQPKPLPSPSATMMRETPAPSPTSSPDPSPSTAP
ncbi:hypothetical protein [Microbacterium sp.]|uniref:hypothetical protein n=1 Tax=Microbacterium sp. TaxID=51671 RepID=UPI00334233A5